MGTNMWLSFYAYKEDENGYPASVNTIHSKFYHDSLGNGGWEIVCYWFDDTTTIVTANLYDCE